MTRKLASRRSPQVKRRNKGGRPAVSNAEKVRRGTYQGNKDKRRRSDPGPRALPLPIARDYLAVFDAYVAGVRSGQIVAGEWVRLACERHVRDRCSSDPLWPYVWDPAHVTRVCQFLERLPHVEGQWSSPTIRLEPAQIFLVGSVFGWRHRQQRERRRFTVVYWEVGRKSAKSTLMAGLALYHVLEEQEPGAQVICGATTGSQARIVFGIAQRMVKRATWLRERGLQALANAIVTPEATIKPVNSEASNLDGLNPSCVVLDESHAQKFALHDVLRSAQGARLNPLMLCPTTAGYDLQSVGYALRTTLTSVLRGRIEAEHFFGAIYTLDEGDDWRNPQTWAKANPMLGITPTLAWVRSYCEDAQQTPGLEAEFRVKVCSEWMQAARGWLSLARWDACADPTLTRAQFAGQSCWIGGDLAAKDDLAAVAYCFELGDAIAAFVQFYLPRDVVEERARTVPDYREWVRAGVLTMTEGNMTDYGVIEADIREACRAYAVQAIRFDSYASTWMLAKFVQDQLPAAELPKTRKAFTVPALDFEARVRHGRFRHDGNACLRWNASNVVVMRGMDGSILPIKEHENSPLKIDGIDAVLQAMSAMLTPAPAAPDFQIMVL